MTGRRESPLAGAVSLALSLSLAAVLLVMTVSADPGRPPPPDRQPLEIGDVADKPRTPDLAVVVLPPPPAVAVAAEPAPPPPLEPPAPTDPPAAAPEPPAPAPVVQETAAPKPARPPQTASRPPARPVPVPVEITPEAVREGRALLRLLENGEGPDIEIAWPAAAADRAELYRLFSDCFGMRTVVMSAAGEMFGAGGDRLGSRPFDGDRYSGFVRQPAGGLSAGEQRQVDAIRRRHGLSRGRVLRLFPRRVDAILLGALDRIAGGGFDKGVRIRARYHGAANGIEVADIRIDGRAAADIVVLPYRAQRTCRAGASR